MRRHTAQKPWLVGLLVCLAAACTRNPADVERERRDAMTASTVRVIVRVAKGFSLGSGIIVGTDARHVITNHHVVFDEGTGEPSLAILVGRRVGEKPQWTEATVIWKATPSQKDVVILRLNERIGPGITQVNTGPAIGDAAIALGFPGVSDEAWVGGDGVSLEDPRLLAATLNRGNISNFVQSSERFAGGAKLIQHQVPISHGNSGGPLFDECGALLGFNTLGVSPEVAQSTYYAVHVSEAIKGLDEKNVKTTVVTPCLAHVPSTPMAVWLTIGLATVLGATAVVLASTKSGRETVRRQVTQLTRRVADPKTKRVPVGASAGASAGAADRPAASIRGAVAAPTAGGRLTALAGEFAGTWLDFAEPITLGRDPALRGLVFSQPVSEDISRRHCEIKIEQGTVMLRDLGSQGGTFLDTGERLPPYAWTDLRPGQSFYLVGRQHLFQVSPR